MGYWYAYTGESLVAGRGRVIQNIVNETAALADFISTSHESYRIHSEIIGRVPKETYSAVHISSLAAQELVRKTKPENFISLKQVYKLFAGLDIGQVAINFLNGRVASSYRTEDIVRQVTDGFASGELFFCHVTTHACTH